MFADTRFDYLTQARYYVAMAVTPVHFVAGFPLRVGELVSGIFQTRRELLAENEALREQMLLQQFELQKLEHLQAENQRLNELLKASSSVDEDVVRTQLAGIAPDPFTKRVLINKGSADDVFVGQSVLDADGLMGQVVDVEPLNSWVLLISDPQHATPVVVNRNGIRAIASGTRDSLHMMTLNNVPTTADVQVGDLLVTSGLGGTFPPGYPVGVVNSVFVDPGKPFADILVTPTAQIDRSRNLLLVFPREDQLAAERQDVLPVDPPVGLSAEPVTVESTSVAAESPGTAAAVTAETPDLPAPGAAAPAAVQAAAVVTDDSDPAQTAVEAPSEAEAGQTLPSENSASVNSAPDSTEQETQEATP
jgi:rod shape-determining protein MreC